MNALEELSESFSRLPGIGKKSAMRISNFLLKSDRYFIERFAKQLVELHSRIKPCSECGSYTETDPCPICSNQLRDRHIICVVEQPQDVTTIENSGEFKGLFHVLGGLIAPLEGIGPEQLSIGKLIERIQKEKPTEVIIATNPTFEGDSTAIYLNQILKKTGVKISRLASGIPVGGDLEYADKLTLARSFRGRMSF